jgi:hypothetical protein
MTDNGAPLPPTLRPPAPPAALRSRTLATARQAVTTDGSDAWTRLWQSRAARLAWAACLGCLLLGHAVLGLGPSAGLAPTAMPLAAAAEPELAEWVELPRLTAELPGFEQVGRTTDTDTDTAATVKERS